MPYIAAKIGEETVWGIGMGELVIPVRSIEGMSAEEIGSAILSLVPDIREWSDAWKNPLYKLHKVESRLKTLDDFKRYKEEVVQQERERIEKKQRKLVVRKNLRGMYHKQFVMVGKRDGFKCRICGSTDANDLQIDHITTVAKEGSNKLANLQLLCKLCNFNKSDHLH